MARTICTQNTQFFVSYKQQVLVARDKRVKRHIDWWFMDVDWKIVYYRPNMQATATVV